MNIEQTSAPSPSFTKMRLGPLPLLTLLSFLILIALGFWQLKRREWKSDLIAKIEAGLSAPVEAYQPPQKGSVWDDDRQFRRVAISGRFLDGATALLYSPTPSAMKGDTGEGYGYFLFSAFQLNGEHPPTKASPHVLFVNRGFVPASLAGRQPIIPAGPATVTGVIRAGEVGGSLTPTADVSKRTFYSADLSAMARSAGLAAESLTVSEYIDAAPGDGNSGWPRARDPQSLLNAIPNNHLQYAFTWFGLAAALVGVFSVYSWRGVRRGGD